MSGIKERRTKILLALFLISDVKLDHASFNQKTQELFDLYLNAKTKSTLNSLVREGLIETDETGNFISCRLTEKGFHELCLNFPYFRFLKDAWDGKWRVLSYEIPESKRDLRDKLRREVAGWGLGPWHRSFWLTPHPIVENLKSLVLGKEEEKYVQVFEGNPVFGDREILIEKVWNKSQLDRKYRDLFKKWHNILSKNEDKTKKFKEVIAEFINILREDPGLPKGLIGDDWIGLEAFDIFREIRTILLN